MSCLYVYTHTLNLDQAFLKPVLVFKIKC